jgi:MYXO-CTERM domain-containing protein
MRAPWLIGVSVSAWLLAAQAFPSRAHACGCVGQTDLERLAQSDAIFEGVVREEGPVRGRDPRDFVSAVRFEVSRRWKGDVYASHVITNSRTSCDAHWRVGTRYLVFAANWQGLPLSDACSGNRENPSGDVLAALGPAMDPLPGVSSAVAVDHGAADVPSGCQLSPSGPPATLVGLLAIALLIARRR